jgi:hypothetical protein
MSENSSSNKLNQSKNIPGKKNVSYSTDYHVNLLEASDKLVQPDDRIAYTKKLPDNTSESEDFNSYLTEKKNIPHKSTNYSDHSSAINMSKKPSDNFASDINKSIFSKQFTNPDKTKDENTDKNDKNENNNEKDENKNFLNEEYDNYNELTPENQMLKKLDMLRKLGELAQYGVKLSQNYNMNSDYFTMKYEHELHKNIRAKQNFINWTSSIMLNCIYGVEILNDKYDPFSLKLTGWSEQINADISNYYDIFGEIYEKYNKPGKSMSPELRIILMLGGSALKFHLNKIAISNRPNNISNEQPTQDPKMLEQMRQQAMMDRMREDSMKQSETSKKRLEEEHALANQQMKDMMFLQQKQKELEEQELLNKKRMVDFERVRMMMESNKKEENNAKNVNKNVSEYDNENVNTILNNAYGGGKRVNGNDVNNQRKIEITQQLQEMKNNINNLNIEKDKTKNTKNDGNGNDSEATSSTSEQNTNSSTSIKKNKSKKEVDISLTDKSGNSKTNQSTFSKRKYKRSGISIDTA